MYIGSSRRSIGNRIGHHFCILKKGIHRTKKFQVLWDSDPVLDNWDMKILEICQPDIVKDRENFWLSQFENILNSVRNATGQGRVTSEEIKAKQRAGRAKYLQTPGARESLSVRAKKQHEEKNFGAHTWVHDPVITAESRKQSSIRMKKYMETVTGDEMSRRSYQRKIFTEEKS